MRKTRFLLPITIIGLLSMSHVAAEGQTFSSPEPQLARPYESRGWGRLLWKGGTIRTKSADGRRTGAHYMQLESGTGSLMRMDFVNGITIGPEVTLGYVTANQSRWELHANVEYACSRHAWMGEGALRYFLPPSQDTWVEIFGGRRTTDYDPDPLLSATQRQIAAGLFAWNGGKLYEAARFGLKMHRWLTRDLVVEGAFWHEARYEMTNHRRTSLFGKKPENNVPRCDIGQDPMIYYSGYYYGSYSGYGGGYVEYSSSDDYDFYDSDWTNSPLLHWQEDHLCRADLTFEYTPHRVLTIADDLHSEAKSTAPTLRLALKTAWDNRALLLGGQPTDYASSISSVDDSRLRYVSVDFSICQSIERPRHRTAYFASAGVFHVNENVGLQDCRHFDAAHFPWLDDMNRSLTWFALLTNYEFSTDDAWMEAHGEYLRKNLDDIGQYVQLHGVAIPDRAHIEASYGWQLGRQMRIGFSIGFDHDSDKSFHYDGIGMNLIVVPD